MSSRTSGFSLQRIWRLSGLRPFGNQLSDEQEIIPTENYFLSRKNNTGTESSVRADPQTVACS
jgi:hypothetical protein